MSDIKKIVILNIDSRYIELLTANIMTENGAREDIKLLARKEHSGIVGDSFANKETFENILSDSLKILASHNIDKVFVGTPSNLCVIKTFEKQKKAQKNFILDNELINEIEDEVKKQQKDEKLVDISTQLKVFSKENKEIINFEDFETNEVNLKFSFVFCKTEFVELVKKVLLNSKIVKDFSEISFISQDIAQANILLSQDQKKNEFILVRIDDYSTSVTTGKSNNIESISSFNLGLTNIEQEIYIKFNLPKYEDAVKMSQSFDIMQDGSKQFYKIKYNNQDYNVPCEIPVNIAKTKVEQIAVGINSAIQSSNIQISKVTEIVLVPTRITNLNGLQSYLTVKLARKSKFVVPSAVKQDPKLTAAYSVLTVASSIVVEESKIKNKKKSIFEKIKKIFKR